MTAPAADELRERLDTYAQELRDSAGAIASANGSGPDEGVVADTLDLCRDAIRDCDRLDVIERSFDPRRHALRAAAEQLDEGLRDGDPAKVRAVADLPFEAHAEARAEESERDRGVDEINRAYQFPEGLRVREVLKSGEGEEQIYALVLSDATRIEIGSSKAVFDPRRFDEAVLPFTAPLGHVPPRITPTDWRNTAITTLRVARLDRNASSEAEQTIAWLEAFIDSPTTETGGGALLDRAPLDLDWEDKARLYNVLADDMPVFGTEDGRLYVRVGALRKFVKRRLEERAVTHGQMERRLVRLGFERPPNKEGKVAARHPESGRTATRAVLRSRPGFTDERGWQP